MVDHKTKGPTHEVLSEGWDQLELTEDKTPQYVRSESRPPSESRLLKRYNVGLDTVMDYGSHILICSPRQMDDWVVGQNRPTLVFHRDVTYCVVASERNKSGWFQYELRPYESSLQVPGNVIHFDRNYVEEREYLRKTVAIRLPAYFLLSVISPLVGLLWSQTKDKLESRYGISTTDATDASVKIERVVQALLFVGPVIILIYTPYRFTAMFIFLLSLLLLVDIFFRKDALMRGREVHQLGLFEFFIRPNLRNK